MNYLHNLKKYILCFRLSKEIYDFQKKNMKSSSIVSGGDKEASASVQASADLIPEEDVPVPL